MNLLDDGEEADAVFDRGCVDGVNCAEHQNRSDAGKRIEQVDLFVVVVRIHRELAVEDEVTLTRYLYWPHDV